VGSVRVRIRQTDVEDGTVYAVPFNVRKAHGAVRGWIQKTPAGWRPYGYEDPTPPRATPDEAIDDLVEMDAEEQRIQRWPE